MLSIHRLPIHLDLQALCRFTPQSHFGPVHLEDSGIAAGSAQARGDPASRQKPHFHQPASLVDGQIDVVEHGRISFSEVNQARENRFHRDLVATELQHGFSMRLSEYLVKYPSLALAYFFCHGRRMASKYGKIKDNKMSQRYSVRPFRIADLDRIMEIERASFGQDAYDRNLFAEYAHKCGELFLVAARSRKVWGYALTCRRGGACQNQAELVSVAVDPAARGTGAAKALMDSTLRRLRPRGVTRWALMVKVTNQRARAFYEKYGFEKVRIVRKYYEDGQDGCLMAKFL